MPEQPRDQGLPQYLIEAINALVVNEPHTDEVPPPGNLSNVEVPHQLRTELRDSLLELIKIIIHFNQRKRYSDWQSDGTARQILRNSALMLQKAFEPGTEKYHTINSSTELKRKIEKIRMALLETLNQEQVMTSEQKGVTEEKQSQEVTRRIDIIKILQFLKAYCRQHPSTLQNSRGINGVHFEKVALPKLGELSSFENRAQIIKLLQDLEVITFNKRRVASKVGGPPVVRMTIIIHEKVLDSCLSKYEC